MHSIRHSRHPIVRRVSAPVNGRVSPHTNSSQRSLAAHGERCFSALGLEQQGPQKNPNPRNTDVRGPGRDSRAYPRFQSVPSISRAYLHFQSVPRRIPQTPNDPGHHVARPSHFHTTRRHQTSTRSLLTTPRLKCMRSSHGPDLSNA